MVAFTELPQAGRRAVARIEKQDVAAVHEHVTRRHVQQMMALVRVRYRYHAQRARRARGGGAIY